MALLEGPLAGIFKVYCRAPRAGYGAPEWSSVPQIIVPLRGAFVVARRGRAAVADATSVLMLGVGDEYRVAHPAHGGDDCAVLVFERAVLDEAVGEAVAREALAPPAAQLGIRLLARALEHSTADPLEAEEAALLLLGELAPALRRPRTGSAAEPRRRIRRQRVEEVRALLATAPAERWHLEAVARSVRCSPFHLARQFRAETGETIARYLIRLRLAVALERLAAGEADLGRLAAEVGFSHHSHFSSRFRSTFGLAPAAARETLTRARLREMRKIVTAAASRAL